MPAIVHVQPVIGLEVHVELATRTKLLSRCPNPAHHSSDPHTNTAAYGPNTLIDPVTLGLPGALPVLNRQAVELSIRVGLALNCSIAHHAQWDRKAYFYADMPKNYQTSQYPMPICFDGSVELPPIDAEGRIDLERYAEERPIEHMGLGGGGGKRIGIIRAHLEEDAGKLMHELPAAAGGSGTSTAIDYSIVDLNRAGTPLLEIVTQPDFTSADEVVAFAQWLRNVCRFVGATEGVMQKGHMRFEPNINCILTLDDGTTVKTPIVEVKNLNSFKSVRGAINYELAEQPKRWLADGKVMGPNAKSTRGWDDAKNVTILQREKEDAHDYRYFPDPDLVPVRVDAAWRERVRAELPELPLDRARRYVRDFGLVPKEAAALTDERADCEFYEATIESCISLGIDRGRAGRLAANAVLQNGAKLVNERKSASSSSEYNADDDSDIDTAVAVAANVLVSTLGITPPQVAAILSLRERGMISAAAVDELFVTLCDPEHLGRGTGVTPVQTSTDEVESLARARNLLIIRDEAAMGRWCDAAIAEQPKAAEDVRAGKQQAIGRLVGAAMKAASAEGRGGGADAAEIRKMLLAKLGQG